MEGEYQEALHFYDAASALQSKNTVVVSASPSWRGKPANEMAAQNGAALRRRVETRIAPADRAAELSLRGVSAISRNDQRSATEDFRKAYAIDPNNAFTLNNIGYLAELEGDEETAQFFYGRARKAPAANEKVIFASRRSAEGLKLFQVAENSDAQVETKLAEERSAIRRQGEPVLLWRRDNSVVEEPSPPAKPSQPVENSTPPMQNPASR
jgi:Flp pilus assembly protein TadD